jgi:carbohydrate kinase (thermoresistant glucokinase family)
MVIVIMGASGAGKTTVGHALAVELGWRYVEGDEAHPARNVAKMRAGVPLNDADRERSIGVSTRSSPARP